MGLLNSYKNKTAGILLLVFITSSLAVPINQAGAVATAGGIPTSGASGSGGGGIAVFDAANLGAKLASYAKEVITSAASVASSISNSITAGGISQLVIKEYVLDPIANFLAKTIIRAVTNTVVSWIQGGGKPMFVQDIGGEVKKAADETAGEFLNRLANTNLCSGFNIDFRFNLTLPRIKRISECTVSGIIGAIKGTTFNKEIGIFYNDFEINGAERGIERYLSLLDPANSFTNSFDKAYYTKASLEIQAGQKRIKVFDWGSGFKPFEWDETKEDPDSCEPGADGRAVCQKVKTGRVMTPGKVVAETLQKSIDVGLDVGVAADELDEAIVSIINALINRVVNGSIQGSSGGGLTSEGLGNIPFDSNENPSTNVPEHRIDDIVIRTEIAQLIVEKNLIAIDEQIIQIKVKIEELNAKIKFCENNPAAIDCSQDKISEMGAEKSSLENQLTELNNKRQEEKIKADKLKVLLERGLALKELFISAVAPSEFTSLGQKMVTLEEDLGILIFEMENKPAAGQATGNSIDNAATAINKISERASVIIGLLDKKILAEKNAAQKTKLTQTKTDIQKLVNDLAALKTQILMMKNDPLADVKITTKNILAKIKELNQKLSDAFNL